MENKMNLVITQSIEPQCLKMIADVGDIINIIDASKLVAAERSGDISAAKKLNTILADVEIICGFLPLTNIVKRAPKLKWHHTLLAGVDHDLYADLFKSSVIVTNSHIHGIQISELVLEMMLMLAKHAPFYFEMKKQRKSKRVTSELLHSKTLGVVGLGSIGKEVARLGKAFHMRVIATKSNPKPTKYADVVLPSEKLPVLLKESDYVVLAVPFTARTSNLIGEKELKMMKPTAYLINIARGTVVDEDVLAKALEEKWIAGAGLDVFRSDPGPLPPNSKFWDIPNVIITPHIAGHIENYNLVAIESFCENLKRYISGKRLKNMVDKKKGY